MFARYGIPRQLVSDNGPQFTSAPFAAFLARNGVRHVRVAPYHPSSNGAAERAVQTVKNGLKAALRDGGSLSQRLQKFLLAYRAAPHAATGRSPAEMMLGRNVRTRLDLLRPDPEEKMREQQQRQWSSAGGPRPLRSFSLGDSVWARNYSGPQKWRRGTVAARTGPVSYEVDVGDALWSRHVDQMLAAEAAGAAASGREGGDRAVSWAAGGGGAVGGRFVLHRSEDGGSGTAAVLPGSAGAEAGSSGSGTAVFLGSAGADTGSSGGVARSGGAVMCSGGACPDANMTAGTFGDSVGPVGAGADRAEAIGGGAQGGREHVAVGVRRSERTSVPPKRLCLSKGHTYSEM